MFFCILVHNHTLYFTGFPCCSVSYYNYTSIRPYYIVIHKSGMRWSGVIFSGVDNKVWDKTKKTNVYKCSFLSQTRTQWNCLSEITS